MARGPSKKNLPVPADFMQHAATTAIYKLSKLYGTRHETIVRWIAECGVARLVSMGNPFCPMPADFRENARTMHRTALMRRYSVGIAKVERWLAECAMAPAKASLPSPYKLEMPGNFSTMSRRMTQAELMGSYGVSRNVIRRWLTEAGAAAKTAPRGYSHPGGLPHTSSVPPRPDTPAARAQMFLQRFGPVFHASIVNPKAPDWVVFGRRVSEADLLATAYRKGFRAEAMAA